jgi:hypothetical protein
MLREASLDHTPLLPARRRTVRMRAIGAGSMGENTRSAAPSGAGGTLVSPGIASPGIAGPAMGGPRLGSAAALPAFTSQTARTSAYPGVTPDPDVFLIALPLAGGGLRPLEGAGRAGAIRVSRPYGHLRSIRPVTLDTAEVDAANNAFGDFGLAASEDRARTTGAPRTRQAAHGSLGSATAGPATMLPARRPLPQVVSAVEVETDAGVFRVERPGGVLAHSDMAWAMAHLEAGEPDSLVPLPRRQLALLLTLLPTPQDAEHPEDDPIWGWAHRLRGPWERGPLHTRGRLGRLIAFDPDESGKGMHRACFELMGSDEVVWAVGVPCFRTGSVYELTPLGKGQGASRWLSWPLAKGRRRAGAPERPKWEIARVVFRVGTPRWPLAGVVEPMGPLGVAG